MREVKVRGYALDEMVNSQWQYGTGIHRTLFAEHFAKEVCQSGETFIWTESGWVQIVEGSQGLYTGLKDKNDCEIYLGDIVKREFELWNRQWEGTLEGNDLAPYDEFECAGFFIGVVSQTPQGLYVLNKCSKYDDEGKFIKKRSNVKLYNHRAEVIGNIYENPELLEVKGNERISAITTIHD